MLLLPSIGLGGCSNAQTPDTVPPENGDGVGTGDNAGTYRTLMLIASNDFHGALYEMRDPDDPAMAIGGLPWLVGMLTRLREDDPHLLAIDGGDVFQGSWPVNATFGQGSVDAFELMGIDVATIGNHEFDYGVGDSGGHPLRGALELAMTRTDLLWVSANIFTEDGQRWQPPGLAPWIIIEREGIRVGVIGLTTQETPQTTLLRNVVDLRFNDVVEAVESVLPEVRGAGAEVIIVSGHLTGACEPAGYLEPGEPCLPGGEIGRLLTELPRGTIDVLVVGHEHTLMSHRYEDTYIFESRAQGHILSRLRMAVGPDGFDPDHSDLLPFLPLTHISVDPGCDGGEYDLSPQEIGGFVVTPSAEALELVRRLELRAGSLCDELACADEPMRRDRYQASAIGSLIGDAMLSSVTADIAIQNSGGLRADLPGGVLRREHIHAVMPFENRILVVELTGEALLFLFRLATSGAHGLPQVGGARYRYNPDETGGSDLDDDGQVALWEQNRLCWVQMGQEPIHPEQHYRVAVSDFLLEGGDHLGPSFVDATVVEEGPLLRDAIIDYVRLQSGCLSASTEALERVELGQCQ